MHAGHDTVGVVLAGGRSSRMGQDKAALPWNGQSLLAHMQQVLCEAGVSRVVLSGRHPQAVSDRIPELGPLGGLASVAETLPDGFLLVVPVDTPLASPGLLRFLCTQATGSNAACVCFEGQPLPLWLRLCPATRSVLAELLAGPAQGRSLRALHAALSGQTLALPAAWSGQLRDADTPADWRALCAG